MATVALHNVFCIRVILLVQNINKLNLCIAFAGKEAIQKESQQFCKDILTYFEWKMLFFLGIS